jgi:hypothetical protein
VPQLHGRAGKSRDWVYVQLGNHWYARSRDWKLTDSGELFDMADAPFVEKPVAAETQDAKARAGQEELQKVLGTLNPASGKTARAPASSDVIDHLMEPIVSRNSTSGVN